jgi:hypothetical protein
MYFLNGIGTLRKHYDGVMVFVGIRLMNAIGEELNWIIKIVIHANSLRDPDISKKIYPQNLTSKKMRESNSEYK